MTEYKLGEEFNHDGLTYIVELDDGMCSECDLWVKCSEITHPCDSLEREDGRSVVFKEVKR